MDPEVSPTKIGIPIVYNTQYCHGIKPHPFVMTWLLNEVFYVIIYT